MASNSNSGVSSSANFINEVFTQAQAIIAGGNQADLTDLFPVQNWGIAERLHLAGIPGLENSYHFPFEQGRFFERPIGDAISQLSIKNLDLQEKIRTYINMNRLAIDGQLSDLPRAIKYAADSVLLVEQIRTFNMNSLAIISALQANIQALMATQMQMQNMIMANANALVNLLHQICNWGLPELPSLAALLGDIFHWNGFTFVLPAGFDFEQLLSSWDSIEMLANFSFGECTLNTPNFAPVFGGNATSVSLGSITATRGVLPLPITGGSYGDPTQYSDPSYIAKMQATTTPVFDPDKVVANNGTSLPTPSTIISNYSLDPSTYQANIVSAVPDLSPALTAANPDSTLRGLSIRYVSLAYIVANDYPPNLMAAWLFYVSLNRAGRAGDWLPNMQAAYEEYITPSLTYLSTTSVPWNQMLGDTTVNDAPTDIPLISTLKGDNGDTILWELSYIEAAMLGYSRNAQWDYAANQTFLDTYTGSDLDYVPSPVAPNPMSTVTLGEGTAQVPVVCSYPQSISGTLTSVIEMATLHIAGAPNFQSNRPQFRFTYNMFAVASLVDRYTQFWREFNANLVELLTQDPYMVQFVVSYPEALDSAIDPLGDSTIYNAIRLDAANRNRKWTPGSVSLPITTPTVLVSTASKPTDLTNGWTGGVFDPSSYLKRPDVQAQSLPTQVAMLRTNESFASLMTLQGNIKTAVQDAISAVNITAANVGMPGWEVETSGEIAIPTGAKGLTLGFGTVDFDQTNYVGDAQTIVIQSTNPYILSIVLNWDTSGTPGVRSLTLLRNGAAIDMVSVDSSSATPYTTQYSAIVNLTIGDKLQVIAAHSLLTPQNVLPGSTFLGLLDTQASQGGGNSTGGNTGGGGTTIQTSTVTFTAGVPMTAFTAVCQQSDGLVYPVDPTVTTPGVIPVCDGIAVSSAASEGSKVSVAVQYGGVYNAPGMNWAEGELLYILEDGTLTQRYVVVASNARWIICIGKAITPTSFLYTPHIPVNYMQNF